MTPKDLDESGQKYLTLRLPDDYHRQVTAEAARLGLTINGHLVNIIRRHLMECGYAPNVIKSLSGRLFEVAVEPLRKELGSDYYCSRFDITENHQLYAKRRAYYIIGVANALAGLTDPYGTVKDLGLALLNYYNRNGLEIDQLAWQSNRSDPSPPRTSTDNWRYIGLKTTKEVASFMIVLARNHWKDELLISTGQSQDLRYGTRTALDLFSGNPKRRKKRKRTSESIDVMEDTDSEFERFNWSMDEPSKAAKILMNVDEEDDEFWSELQRCTPSWEQTYGIADELFKKLKKRSAESLIRRIIKSIIYQGDRMSEIEADYDPSELTSGPPSSISEVVLKELLTMEYHVSYIELTFDGYIELDDGVSFDGKLDCQLSSSGLSFHGFLPDPSNYE